MKTTTEEIKKAVKHEVMRYAKREFILPDLPIADEERVISALASLPVYVTKIIRGSVAGTEDILFTADVI